MIADLEKSLVELFRDQYCGIHSLEMHQDNQPLYVLGNSQPLSVFQGEPTYSITIRLRFDRNMRIARDVHEHLSIGYNYPMRVDQQRYSNTSHDEAIVYVTYKVVDIQMFIQNIKDTAWKAFNKSVDKALNSILTEET